MSFIKKRLCLEGGIWEPKLRYSPGGSLFHHCRLHPVPYRRKLANLLLHGAPLESIQSSRHLSFTSTSVTLSPFLFSYLFRVEKYFVLETVITKMENCNKDVSKCEDIGEAMKEKHLKKLVT